MSSGNAKALLLVESQLDGVVAGGLTVSERWRRGLKAAGFPVQDLTSEAFIAGRETGATNLILADGSVVFEQAVLEPLRDNSCADDEALVLSSQVCAGTPAIRIGCDVAIALSEDPVESFDSLLARLQELQDAGEARVTVVTVGDVFWRRVSNTREAREAAWNMLKRLRLRPGGLAAQAVNRRVSVPITRMLLPLPISPNWMTTITGLIGLAASAAMIQGGYWWALAGAFLMQMSSIMDGCDGEIARMKYQSSEFGGWYDSIWDEWVNAIFLAAVGYNLSVSWDFQWFMWMGLFAGGVSITYAFFQWHSKYKHGIGLYWWWDQGKPKKVIWESKSLVSYLKKIFWRDSFLLIYFIATALWYPLPVVLAISTGGTIGVFVLLVIHIFIKRARW